MRHRLNGSPYVQAILCTAFILVFSSSPFLAVSGDDLPSACATSIDCVTCSSNSACAWIPHYNHTIKNDNYGWCRSLNESSSLTTPGIVTFNSTHRCPIPINVTTPAAGQYIPSQTWIDLIFFTENVTRVSLIETYYDMHIPNKIVSRDIILQDVTVNDGRNERNWWFQYFGPASTNMAIEVVAPVPDASPLTGPYIAYGRSAVGIFSSCVAQTCGSCISIFPFNPSPLMYNAYSCSWDPASSTCRTLQDVQIGNLSPGIQYFSGCITLELNETESVSPDGLNQYFLNESIIAQICVADTTKLQSFELELVNSTDGARFPILLSSGALVADVANFSNATTSWDYEVSTSFLPPFGSSSLTLRIPNELPASTYHLSIYASSGGMALTARSDEFVILQTDQPPLFSQQLGASPGGSNEELSSGAIAGISVAGFGSLVAIAICIHASNRAAAAAGRSGGGGRSQSLGIDNQEPAKGAEPQDVAIAVAEERAVAAVAASGDPAAAAHVNAAGRHRKSRAPASRQQLQPLVPPSSPIVPRSAINCDVPARASVIPSQPVVYEGPRQQFEPSNVMGELSEEPGLPAYEAAMGHDMMPNFEKEGQIQFQGGEGEPHREQ